MTAWTTTSQVIQNLRDAGCPEELIRQFIQETDNQYRLTLLASYRKGLLDSIHVEQRKLDCLDYLMFNMRKEHGTSTQ